MTKSRRMRWAWHVARLGERRVAYRTLARKSWEKTPLRRHRRIWKENIKKDLQKVGWGTWIGLIWLRIGIGWGSFKSGNEPSVSIKCGDFLDYLKTG